MEYIREALERQEAALRLLLTGWRSRAEQAPPEASGGETRRTAAGQARQIPAAASGGVFQIGEAAYPETAPAGELRRALFRRSEARRQAAGIPGLAGPRDPSARPAGERTDGLGRVRTEDRRPRPAGEAGGAEEVLTVRTAGPAAGGEHTEAKDLSRAFQRDARRYDGGFRLYD